MNVAPIGSTRGQNACPWPRRQAHFSGCGTPRGRPSSAVRPDGRDIPSRTAGGEGLSRNSAYEGRFGWGEAGPAVPAQRQGAVQPCAAATSADPPRPASPPHPSHPTHPASAPPWLSRVACFAVAAATTLGVLAGSASADFAIGPAAAAVGGGGHGGMREAQPALVASNALQHWEQPLRRPVAVTRIAEAATGSISTSGSGAVLGPDVGPAPRLDPMESTTPLQPGGLKFLVDSPTAAASFRQRGLVTSATADAAAAPSQDAAASGWRWAVRSTGTSPSPGPWSGLAVRTSAAGARAAGLPAASAALSRPAGDDAGGAGDGPHVSEPLSGELASETEDRLLEAARQVEARVEGMLGALTSGVPQLLAGPEAAEGVARSTTAAHSLIREVWEVVDANYLDARSTGFNRQRWAELRDEALALPYRDSASAYRAVRDLLARGLSDPYCRFIGPSELEAMKKYDVSGVGLNLGTAAEYVIKTGNGLPAPRDTAAGEGVYVVGVSKGSTADVAGIRQGDELLAIQGESLESSTPFRAAGLISGAVQQQQQEEAQAAAAPEAGGSGAQRQAARARGSQGVDEVLVKVRHPSGAEEELSLVRPRRTIPSVVTTSITRSAVQLPGGGRAEEVVGTVRLAAFNARAQADVATAIRKLEAAGSTRLVLDLRDNRGGLVTEGLEVARLFLEGDAPIVITERRDAAPDTPTAPGPPLTASPLLVLVNGHTASASEIVAGALRDNCRAVLAGSRTYGKGLIQSVYELSDGSGLVITVGKYLTPRGNDIDRYGIKPDFSSVPSSSQYDSTVKACKLTAPLAAAEAPALTVPVVYP